MRNLREAIRKNLLAAATALVAGAAGLPASMAHAGSELLTAESKVSSKSTTITSINSFGDWQVTCSETSTDRRCEMETQGFSEEDGSKPRISISLSSLETNSGARLFVLKTPLDLLLAKGIEMQIDHGKVMRLAYRSCRQDGCLAPFSLDASLLRKFRRGKSLKLHIFNLRGEPLAVTLSLAGFTEASRDAARQREQS